MSIDQPKVITKKQAQKQIGYFGNSLIWYIIAFTLLYHGTDFLHRYYPQIFRTYDHHMMMLLFAILAMIVLTAIPFRLTNKKLSLKIRDYLKKPKIPTDRKISIICIGIGISLLTTSIASIFRFFLIANSQTASYLGQFNNTTNIINNILYICLFIIIKPICDEYIFRGIIQRQLGHYGRYFGVLGSAMLYAISSPSLSEAIPAFFVGWYLSLLTLKYHSIRPSIAVSITLSLFNWLLIVIPGNLIWIISILIVIVYIVSAFSIFSKRVSTNMVRYGATEWKLWKILLTTPSIIVCVILFLINVILAIII